MEVSKQPNNDRQNIDRTNKKFGKKRKKKSQIAKNKPKVSLDGKDLLPTKKKIALKSSLPPVDVKKVKEPLLTCGYCNKVISNIANAIKGDEIYFHFDCIINKIKEDYKVKDSQSVSYIGRGSFAIVEKDSEGKLHFVETIQIETPQQFDLMKKFVEEVKI